AQIVVEKGPTGGERNSIDISGLVNAAVIAEEHSLVGGPVKSRVLHDDVLVGMRRVRGALPLADFGQTSPAVGAAPKVNPADDQDIGVGGVHPNDVVIPTLGAQVIIAGVAERVSD